MTDPARRLHDLLRHGDRLAVVSPDGVTATFGELDRQTRSIAGWLSEHTEPGDRVAVVADNSLAYVQLYYAVPRAGRILALVNQRLSPAEQAAVITASEPRVLAGDARYLDALPALEPPAETVVAFGSPRWREAAGHRPYDGPSADPGDPVWLVFTSGSTGTPKGVLHTHRSLLAAARGSVEGRQVPSGGVYLFPFPMCHISGYNVLVQHATGSAVVLAARFRPPEFVAAVNAYKVTSCSLAPTMLHALLAYLDETGETMPTLRAIAYGSAAISADLLSRAIDRLGVDFHQGYGMTETGGNVTFLGPAAHRAGAAGDPAILRTAGHPHSAVEIGIDSDTGEVLVRGEQVMSGYWRADPADAFTGRDGGRWLRTGDIGRTDADGRLSIIDRAKDVIITGGENVASREVEDALSTHPGVDMVAVVGVPDPYWGEAICAVVVPRAGSAPSADDLIAHARARLSAFKRPRHVVFTGALPLTSNGKIAKDQVRALARLSLTPEGAPPDAGTR